MREWNIEGWVVNFYLDNVMIQPSLFHPLIVYLFRPIFVCVHLMKLSLLTQNCLLMLVTDCYLSLLIILFCLFVFFIRFKTSNPNCTFNALDHPMHFLSNSTRTLSGFRDPLYKRSKIRCERKKWNNVKSVTGRK